MKCYTCEVRKEGNPDHFAIIAVVTDSIFNVESIIHKNYGSHLLVSNIELSTEDIVFQIGGNLIAVREK